jgi:hypothetical protein
MPSQAAALATSSVSPAPAPAVIPCSASDVVSELRAAWQKYQIVERLGISFGQRLYELRIASSAQGNHSGKGFLPLLQQAGIPQRTAYYWIHSYEISIGEREPEEKKKKSAKRPVKLKEVDECEKITALRILARAHNYLKGSYPFLEVGDTASAKALRDSGGSGIFHAQVVLRELFYRERNKVVLADFGSQVIPETPSKIEPVEARLTIAACGDAVNLYSKSGTMLVTGYERVVFGKRGPYLEMTEAQMVSRNLRHCDEQRHVYFKEFRSTDDSNVMVYHQRRKVAYADYRVGMWYISPDDLVTQDGQPVIRPAGIAVNAGGQ